MIKLKKSLYKKPKTKSKKSFNNSNQIDLSNNKSINVSEEKNKTIFFEKRLKKK